MKILDLFAGLGGERRRPQIEARGHEYVTLDFDPKFGCTITSDILKVTAEILGHFDFGWASPPCEAFSVASIGHHWKYDGVIHSPKTEHAVHSQNIVAHTRKIFEDMNPPKGFLIENPRGILRKLPCVQGLRRVTVTYCQYGDSKMKPTDIWGHVPNWSPRPPCKNGDKCHESAPRGSRTGTQGIIGAADRAIVPWGLWGEILDAAESQSVAPNPEPFEQHQLI